MPEVHDFSIESKEESSRLGAESVHNTLLFDALLEGEATKEVEEPKDQLSAIETQLLEKFGVTVNEKDGKYQYSFRADGKDHIVWTGEATDQGLKGAPDALSKLRETKMQDLNKKFHVTFAQPGEDATNYSSLDKSCNRVKGEMVKAANPTFPQLYATELGIARSQPSQLNATGADGIKIYFLEEQIMPSPYGNKPALGVYFEQDKDRRRALMITPDGAKLPPTENDTEDPDARILAQVIVHELGHNGIENLWPDDQIPKPIAESLGWKPINRRLNSLKGKNGFLYIHTRVDGCNNPTSWIRLNGDFNPVNSNGNPSSIRDSYRPTNEELMELAQVRPTSYYFPNPEEMLNEGITSFRYSADSRAKLLKNSPELYSASKMFDRVDISRFYGLTSGGKSRYVRLPEGRLVKRSAEAEEQIRKFEDEHKRDSK